jgi:hypothetical protein
VLAGSWTDTGWPDTMEGAVRSGLSAVIALHEQADNEDVVSELTSVRRNSDAQISTADSVREVRS